MLDPKVFIEGALSKRIRYLKEDALVLAGKFVGGVGGLNGYPRNPIFILGAPRSGTSLFNRMLSEHPHIANLSEAVYIWEPKDKNFNRDHVKRASDADDESRSRLRHTFGLYQRIKGKDVFCNKCPRSSVRIEFINTIFPDAQFVHLVRDGRAVVNSILSIIEREDFRKVDPFGKFCRPDNWREYVDKNPLERFANQWVGILDTVHNDKQGIDQSRWIEIKYEELCTKPDEVLRSTYQALGLPIDEITLANATTMPSSMNYKWKAKFGENEADLLRDIMSKWLIHYGYE